MSGIAGIHCPDGRPVDRADLERMHLAIAHRGPDRFGQWSDGPVGLAHRMLYTTPESLGETLPALSRRGDLAITADARIDNRDELSDWLGLTASEARQCADSTLILLTYEKWGEGCVDKLLGDFAFAIWDARRKVLFGARDHMGVRPFVYHRSGRGFFFASEIKALLAVPEIPREIDETRIADYLVSFREDKEITFYQGILRLPPAHTLTVGDGVFRIARYWTLDPEREICLQSDEEYAEAYRAVFTEAVSCRLRSAYPVGSMLSGGLDSSSIVAVARELVAADGKAPLKTFSAVFDDLPQCDERQYINAVVAQGGVQSNFVPVDKLNPLADRDPALWPADGPFFSPTFFLTLALYRYASPQGVRVMLDGFGGDQVVSYGFEYLIELALSRRCKALYCEASRLGARYKPYWKRIVWEYMVKPMIPKPVRAAWRAGRRLAARGNHSTGLVETTFADRIGLRQRLDKLGLGSLGPIRMRGEAHRRRLLAGANSANLEEADRVAWSFTVEARYPFFDRRMVEFCLALPSQQKLRAGWTRYVARRAMTQALPEQVAWRTGKAVFDSYIAQVLRMNGLANLERSVFEPRRLIEKYVNVGFLRRVFDSFPASERDDWKALWRVAVLACWLRERDVLLEV